MTKTFPLQVNTFGSSSGTCVLNILRIRPEVFKILVITKCHGGLTDRVKTAYITRTKFCGGWWCNKDVKNWHFKGKSLEDL